MVAKIKVSKYSLRSIQSNILSKGFLYYLGEGRKNASCNEFLPLLTWIMTATRKGRPIYSSLRQILFPRTIKDLKLAPLLPKVSLDRDIYWFAAVVVTHARRINRYISLRKEYENFLLENQSGACWDVLNTIESEFGCSIWLIESKISHLQYFEGVEAQKNYLAMIKDQGVANVPWLANTFSVRNEEPTTFFRYVARTSEFLDEIPDIDLRASLKFQALSILPEDPDLISGVFYHETNSSLIDIYNLLMEVIQYSVINESSSVRAQAIDCLVKISGRVLDDRLSRLMFIAGKSEHAGQKRFDIKGLVDIRVDSSLVTINDFAPNDWPAAWKFLAERFTSYALKAGAENNFQSRAIKALHEIYSKGIVAEQTLAETLKWTFAFRWVEVSRLLHGIVLEELSTSPILDVDEALHRYISTSYLDPYFIPYLPEEVKHKYLFILDSQGVNTDPVDGNIWSGDFFLEGLTSSIAWQTQRKTIDLSSSKFLEGDFSESLTIAKSLLNSEHLRIKRLGARLVAACLSKSLRFEELLELVAATIVADPGSTDLMPIAECAQVLSSKEARKKFGFSLAVPIVLFVNSTHYSDHLDKILAYSYEDFLIKHKLMRPSEIIYHIDKFDLKSLVFYLKNVCVPNIMKVSSVFTGSVELQDERLAVCSLLLTLDEPNSKIYESEIREITRAQIIRSGVRHVEQSKMSIDVTAIRKICDKKLKETFFRYRAMIAAGINPSDDFAEAYMQLISNGKPLPSEFLKVPTDEAGTLLRELVSSIFQESTNNSMHGLDCYLSMRIRHGALSGQLRGPLELERVITQLDKNNNSYLSNEAWLSELTEIISSARDQIDLGLCIFSARYDSLIERLTNNLIQIHSLDKPEGLFYLNISSVQFRLLATLVSSDTTFDEFFDECINFFWSSVEYCLISVQAAIDNVVKPEINDIFNTLQSTIREAAQSQHTADLDRAIRTAQTNSLQACEQMKDWFKLPTPRAEPLFEVEQLIDIGLQCVQRVHKDFDPCIEKVIDELPRIAGSLTIFSDIFFILFDNARKYAHLGASPKLWITVKRDSATTLGVKVESEVGAAADIEIGMSRVQAIRSLIESGGYHDSLKSEGGTGLIKLKKIIGPSHELDFGYIETTRFFVKFSLALREISL